MSLLLHSCYELGFYKYVVAKTMLIQSNVLGAWVGKVIEAAAMSALGR